MGRRERTLRNSVCENLAGLHAVAVENPVLPGTPDVNVLDAWIELKSLEDWPARAATAIRCDHYTPEQKVFHMRRSVAGGRVYVLLEVCLARDYLLLEGAVAAKILGKANRRELVAASLHVWKTKAVCMAGLRAFLSPHNVAGLPHDPDADLLAGP